MTNVVECASGATVNPDVKYICTTLVVMAVIWLLGKVMS